MRLYLVRHFESVKNKRTTLSSASDAEGLTARGRTRARTFSRALRAHAEASEYAIDTILASSSARGAESAKIIARVLGVTNIQSCPFLRSTMAGPYAGFSSAKIKRVNWEWHHAFQLYRAGLFNQYKFDEPPLAIGAEPKAKFERRVMSGLLPFLADSKGRSIVVVANRSSLTAIMLYFARKYYGYPKNFYGVVSFDLGSVSILERNSDGRWRIAKINSRLSAPIKR
jgi:broad specificity phosphatase PhoE